MNFAKSILYATLFSVICAAVLVYGFAVPTKYSSIVLISFIWVGILRYRETHKILKSLSITDRNKQVIAHGPAELVGPAATIGGWLYLMVDGLIFTPDSYFVNSNVVSIPFCRVRTQSTELGFSLRSYKFQIITTEGQEYVFSVHQRDFWSRLLDTALSEQVQAVK
jgi:hypothetical protein